jgi:hypothetical protein
MGNASPVLTLRHDVSQRSLLMPAVRIARALQASEPEYRDAVRALEEDPLFLRLSRGPGSVFSRAARPGRFCWAVLEPGCAASGIAAFAEFPEADEPFLELMRSIGRDRFARCFLGETGCEDEAAARALSISVEDVRRIRAYVDRFFACAPPPAPARPSGRTSFHVARIDREGERLEVRYLSAHYARGRYRIDYDALCALRRAGALSREEHGRLRGIVQAVEALNGKLTALDAVLSAVVREQKEYLLSGDRGRLLPLAQKEAAAAAGLSPSSFCRALSGRSVLTPWGGAAALADFFPSRRERVGRLVAQVLEAGPATDETVRKRLRERGVKVSRRLVNLRRREYAR